MAQILLREMGDIGEMVKVDRLGRERLAGEINVVRARAATAAKPAAPCATARAGRAEIKNVERAIRRVRRHHVEGHQPSRQKSQNLFDVFHVKISSASLEMRLSGFGYDFDRCVKAAGKNLPCHSPRPI